MIDTYSVDERLRSLMLRTLSRNEDSRELYAEAHWVAKQEAERLSIFSRAHWRYRRLARIYRP